MDSGRFDRYIMGILKEAIFSKDIYSGILFVLALAVIAFPVFLLMFAVLNLFGLATVLGTVNIGGKVMQISALIILGVLSVVGIILWFARKRILLK